MRGTPSMGMPPVRPAPVDSAFMWLAVVQGLFFLLPLSSTPARLFGIALSIGIILAHRRTTFSATTRTAVIVGLSVVAAANFAGHLINTNGVYPFRLWQVALVLSYITTFVAFAVSRMRRTPFSKTWMVCGVPMAVVLLLEGFISGPVGIAVADGAVEWVGQVAPDTSRGTYFAPSSVVRSLYPDNPRKYFDEPGTLEKRWTLNTHNGSVAGLEFPPNPAGVMRIAIDSQPEKVEWHIALSQSPIRVQANEQYELRFRAKADSVRSVFAAVGQAHEPWATLGLYKEIRLSTDWRDYSQTFRSEATDRNAQLFFNFGAESPSVDLADITLRAISTDKIVQADERVERSITYRLNNLGCREADMLNADTLSAARRILALGDGSTLGAGVHRRDTYAARLQTLLNESRGVNTPGAPEFNVVNCGSLGSSTDDQRKIFRHVAPTYHPDAVVLSVRPDDYRFFLDEGVPQHALAPGKLGQLFHLWAVIDAARQPESVPPDLSPIIAGVRQLAADVRSTGAHFGVVLFRVQQTEDWARLDSALTTGLQDLNIPVLDLGSTLLPFGEKELMVDARFDTHPNELAHRLAAESLRKFLTDQGMLNGRNN